MFGVSPLVVCDCVVVSLASNEPKLVKFFVLISEIVSNDFSTKKRWNKSYLLKRKMNCTMLATFADKKFGWKSSKRKRIQIRPFGYVIRIRPGPREPCSLPRNAVFFDFHDHHDAGLVHTTSTPTTPIFAELFFSLVSMLTLKAVLRLSD